MAVQTLKIEQPVQLDNGLIIPASAGAGKVLTSDASGNLTLQSPVTGFLTPTAKTTTYTAAANDAVIATSGTFTVTSPAHSNSRFFSVTNKGTGVITVSAAAGSIFGPGLQSGGTHGLTSITLAQDAYVLLISDGTNWYVTAGGQNTGWVSLTPAGSWASTGGIQYRKDANGQVRFRGTFSTVGGSGTQALTLPAGVRPGGAVSSNFPIAVTSSAGPVGYATITNAGAFFLTYSGGTSIDIDSVEFYAEN